MKPVEHYSLAPMETLMQKYGVAIRTYNTRNYPMYYVALASNYKHD